MILNFMQLTPGQKLRLKDGRVAEVLENMGDGIWVQARFLEPDGKTRIAAASEDGELVHCEEVSGLVGAEQQ